MQHHLKKYIIFRLSSFSKKNNSRRLKGQEQHIKKVVGTPDKPQSSTQSCCRCGEPNHTPAECRYRDAICNACGKKGHIAPACRSNPWKKYYSPGNSQKSKKKTHGMHHVKRESQLMLIQKKNSGLAH